MLVITHHQIDQKDYDSVFSNFPWEVSMIANHNDYNYSEIDYWLDKNIGDIQECWTALLHGWAFRTQDDAMIFYLIWNKNQ